MNIIIVCFSTIIACRACIIMAHFDLSQKLSLRVVLKEVDYESLVSPLDDESRVSPLI